MRLGEVFEIKGRAFLGIEERKTPDTNLIAKYQKEKINKITLEPGEYYLVKTIEKVNLPEEIGAVLYTRGTLFRSGIIHGLSQISPGYSGELITSL